MTFFGQGERPKVSEPSPDLLSLGDQLAEAARTFFEKMAAIEASPEYRVIWESAFIHGVTYCGAKWEEEREKTLASIAAWDAARKGIDGHEFGR